MLNYLRLENVGPASRLDVAFGDRLNVFTGDNGLGKTFLLDVAWWILTSGGDMPSPKPNWWGDKPKITYQLGSHTIRGPRSIQELDYQLREQTWASKPDSFYDEVILGIYAKVDGGFALFDSLRHTSGRYTHEAQSHCFNISNKQIWNGLQIDGIVLCNGLVQDWVQWQNKIDQKNFSLLWQIVETLFPASETPTPGQTTRISLQDVRDIPTLQLAYATVPITQLSAGMKRVLCLAYSLVWAWYEHQKAAEFLHVEPAKKMFLFIDEIEAHLHPQWQRSIFPAIIKAIKLLDPQIQVQVLVTTHSPLVLASLEPSFDEAVDKLFGFELVDREIKLQEFPWTKLGEVDHWLTSPVFGLSRPRSQEAEMAMDAAYAIMRRADLTKFPDYLRNQEDIHQELLRVLPDDDSFWRRWIVTADRLKVS
jgi:AAA domain, putative AbiEii toxin, Type IV TA system/AAA domain